MAPGSSLPFRQDSLHHWILWTTLLAAGLTTLDSLAVTSFLLVSSLPSSILTTASPLPPTFSISPQSTSLLMVLTSLQPKADTFFSYKSSTKPQESLKKSYNSMSTSFQVTSATSMSHGLSETSESPISSQFNSRMDPQSSQPTMMAHLLVESTSDSPQ